MTKWLCICQYGHSRSVALCRALHARDLEAVAVGAGTGGSAIPGLAAWADRIALFDPAFRGRVPAEHQHKLRDFDIGPDRWSNPYHPELRRILEERLDQDAAQP